MRVTRAGLVRAVVVGLVAAASGGALASPASAESWAYADTFTWGVDFSQASGDDALVDPTTHTLYAKAGSCGPGTGCSFDYYIFAGIDGESRQIDGFCSALYPAEHLFSCADPKTKAIVRFRSGTRLDTIALGRTPAQTAVDTSDGTVWVTVDVTTSSRELLSVKNGVVTSHVALPWEPSAIVVDASSHAAWLLNKAGDSVVRVAGGTVGTARAVPYASRSLQVDPNTHLAYVISPGAPGALTSIPPTGPSMSIALVQPEYGVGGYGYVLDPARGEAIVKSFSDQRLWVYKGGTLVDTIDSPVAEELNGLNLVIDASAHVIYGVNYGGRGIKIVLTDEPSVKLGRATGSAATDLTRLPVAVFSKPMDHASTEAAFTVAAASTIGGAGFNVPGTVAWLGDTVAVFVPDTPVPFGAHYVATISSAAKSKDGRALLRPFSWSFTSRGPRLLAAGAAADDQAAVPVTALVYAIFDGPMDQAAFASVSELTTGQGGTPVPGRIGWLTPSVVVFVPDAPLEPNTTYLWRIGGPTTFFNGPEFTTAG